MNHFPTLDFVEASCWGDVLKVSGYLKLGGKPDQVTDGISPLLCAHRFGQREIMELFSSRGYEITQENYHNDVWLMQFEDGMLPVSLHAMDFCSNTYRVFELNNRKISPSNASEILYCASKDDLRGLALSALNSGYADPDYSPVFTYPLHFAAYHGNAELLTALIRSGATIDVPDIGENTPMHNAAIVGNMEDVKALALAGANPMLENAYGDTALDVARKIKNRDVQIWLTRFQNQYRNLSFGLSSAEGL